MQGHLFVFHILVYLVTMVFLQFVAQFLLEDSIFVEVHCFVWDKKMNPRKRKSNLKVGRKYLVSNLSVREDLMSIWQPYCEQFKGQVL